MTAAEMVSQIKASNAAQPSGWTRSKHWAPNDYNDLEAQTYIYAQVRGWLTPAGFARPRQNNWLKTLGFSLVLAPRLLAAEPS